MPRVYPFKGIYYNIGKVENPSLVLTQPYDKIDQKLQEIYYNRHPFNLIRIIKGKDYPDDTPVYNKYTRASELLEKWLEEKVLLQDKKPCIYPYYQYYNTPEGQKTRKGFVALVEVEELSKGKIFPHEQTHTKPIEDRLQLLRATGTYFGQIFMLYSDPQNKINNIIDKYILQHEPLISCKDDFNEIHKLWRIDSPQIIEEIKNLIEPKDIIIADGHHRYKSSYLYLKERGIKEGTMATLINMDDVGLFIFPTHRVVYGLKDFDMRRFLNQCEKYFDISVYPFFDEDGEALARIELIEDLKITGLKNIAYGVVTKEHYYLFKLKDRNIPLTQILQPKSPDWKLLDVNVLHNIILEKFLGITQEDLQYERYVDYLRYADEVIERIKKNRYNIGFLLNPVKVEQIKKVVKNRETLPQKTTDFYPKLLSGIVMYKIEGRNYA
jgi:uncharacterized protein (DUF1015 family)